MTIGAEAARFFVYRGLSDVACRASVMAVRAASAVPADTEGVSELLDAVLDSLDEVLREVRIGNYIPR